MYASSSPSFHEPFFSTRQGEGQAGKQTFLLFPIFVTLEVSIWKALVVPVQPIQPISTPAPGTLYSGFLDNKEGI